jgi:hypothetical protein
MIGNGSMLERFLKKKTIANTPAEISADESIDFARRRLAVLERSTRHHLRDQSEVMAGAEFKDEAPVAKDFADDENLTSANEPAAAPRSPDPVVTAIPEPKVEPVQSGGRKGSDLMATLSALGRAISSGQDQEPESATTAKPEGEPKQNQPIVSEGEIKPGIAQSAPSSDLQSVLEQLRAEQASGRAPVPDDSVDLLPVDDEITAFEADQETVSGEPEAAQSFAEPESSEVLPAAEPVELEADDDERATPVEPEALLMMSEPEVEPDEEPEALAQVDAPPLVPELTPEPEIVVEAEVVAEQDVEQEPVEVSHAAVAPEVFYLSQETVESDDPTFALDEMSNIVEFLMADGAMTPAQLPPAIWNAYCTHLYLGAVSENGHGGYAARCADRADLVDGLRAGLDGLDAGEWLALVADFEAIMESEPEKAEAIRRGAGFGPVDPSVADLDARAAALAAGDIVARLSAMVKALPLLRTVSGDEIEAAVMTLVPSGTPVEVLDDDADPVVVDALMEPTAEIVAETTAEPMVDIDLTADDPAQVLGMRLARNAGLVFVRWSAPIDVFVADGVVYSEGFVMVTDRGNRVMVERDNGSASLHDPATGVVLATCSLDGW